MARSVGHSSGHLPRWVRVRPARTSPARPGTPWRFQRAVERIEPATTAILADHAASYWQRGLSRRQIGDSTVVWAIDGEPVLEFRFAHRGPSSLVVHDFSLYDPLRRAIRTRHVRLRFAGARDLGRPGIPT
jgi:hypothetical protein